MEKRGKGKGCAGRRQVKGEGRGVKDVEIRDKGRVSRMERVEKREGEGVRRKQTQKRRMGYSGSRDMEKKKQGVCRMRR